MFPQSPNPQQVFYSLPVSFSAMPMPMQIPMLQPQFSLFTPGPSYNPLNMPTVMVLPNMADIQPQTQSQPSSVPCNLSQTIERAQIEFIESLPNKDTKKTYNNAFHAFYKQGFLNPNDTLHDLLKINMETKLDEIRENIKTKKGKTVKDWTAQTYCSAFVSFTAFLQRYSAGLFRKVLPNTRGTQSTYRFKQEKTNTTILTVSQLKEFFQTLKGISTAAHLIAVLCYGGARRISEVLSLKLQDINWAQSSITFCPKKTKGIFKTVQVYYPSELMLTLKSFLPSKSPDPAAQFVFSDPHYHDVKMKKSQIDSYFRRAWKAIAKKTDASDSADLKRIDEDFKNVFPKGLCHSLRSSSITHMVGRGIQLDKIRLVSGHARCDQVSYYDMTGQKFNPSKTHDLLYFL